jgi:triosephosphate isomerase (TIM)
MAIRPLIAGNWKMNGLRADAVALATRIVDSYGDGGAAACDVLVCPPFLHLEAVSGALAGSAVLLGGQDCHDAESGAHTGDVSAAMLRDAECCHCIVGHSERRADHGEDDALIRAKATALHQEGLIAVICVGETLAQRDAGTTLQIVETQLRGSLPDGATASNTVIAYEPVWAIGTGRTPSLEQVGEVHDHIRSVLTGTANTGMANTGEAVRILYGGSVNPGNARDILALANVNGGLVGGASLKIDDFCSIIQSCG